MTARRAVEFIAALRRDCEEAADFRSQIETETGHRWDDRLWEDFVRKAQLDGRTGHELRMALHAGIARFAEHVLARFDEHAEHGSGSGSGVDREAAGR